MKKQVFITGRSQMRKYVVTVLTNSGKKSEEWAEWCKDHVADMIRLSGFIGSQAFRVRPDFSYAHPEVLPTLPPYDVMTFYEVDDKGLEFLTTNRREAGAGPEAGTRPFPSPLGAHVGDTFLWETISPEYRALSERPETKRRFVTVFTNSGDKPEEWAEWGKDHVADMIRMPIFTGTQAFRVRPDFSFAHPEGLPTLPPYKLLTFYEINDEGLEFLTTNRREIGAGPEAGTRPFPSPLGAHVGDTFLWEAISPEYRALDD